MNPLEIFEIFGLGCVVGLVSTFLGIGGGLLIVPLLPWVMGLSHHQSIATSLFTIFFVASINTFMFHRQKRVVWRVARIVGPVTVTFSFLSGWIAVHMSESFLKFFLLGVFGLVLIQSSEIFAFTRSAAVINFFTSKKALWSLGTVAGITSGLGGIGSGLILAPFLLAARIVRSDEVTPTSNAIMALTTFAGTVSFMWTSFDLSGNTDIFGFVKWEYALIISNGAILTSFIGKAYQHRMSDTLRKNLLMALLFSLICRVVWELTFTSYGRIS